MLKLQTVAENFIIKRYNYAYKIDTLLEQEYNYDAYNRFIEYKNAVNATDTLAAYTYTLNDLAQFTQDPVALNTMYYNYETIPTILTEDQQRELLAFKRENARNAYVEYNNYYRTLLGLPPMIKNSNNLLSADTTKFLKVTTPIIGVDISKPVHLYTETEKKALSVSGVLKRLIRENPKLEYLFYLDKNIDIIDARAKFEYEVIWIDTDVSDMAKFYDHYRLVLNHHMTTSYSEYDAATYDFYEPLQCLQLIMTTLAHVAAYEPRNSIDSQTINEAEIYNLFQTYGLPKFNFSLKYLNEIAARINGLTMRKGTKAVIQNISDMFNEITIFKYFIVKRLVNKGETSIDGLSDSDKYELYYVRTPLGVDDPYPYVQDNANLIPFEKVAKSDARWGDGTGDILEKDIKEMDFSYAEGKYLGLDDRVNLATFSLEIAHFYRYVIEHKETFKNIKFYIETADYNATLFELITYLQCLIFRKLKVRPDIPDTLSSVLYMYSIKNHINYEELKLKFKNHFRFTKYNTINIDAFIDLLDGKKYNMGDVIDAFEVNYNLILFLKEFQRNTLLDIRDYEAVDTVIKAVTYGEKIPEYYDNKTNLEEFLASYSPESLKLIIRMDEIGSEADFESAINNEISEVINYMREFVDEKKNTTFLNMLDTTQAVYSDSDLIKYLEKIIDFYKSYTQDLFSRGLTYALDTIDEGIKVAERLAIYMKLQEWELVTLSLIFTDKTNEFLQIVKENLLYEDVTTCNDTLEMIMNPDKEVRLLGFGGYKII